MTRNRSLTACSLLICLILWPQGLRGEAQNQPVTETVTRTEKLPVKEVTIFKDGHALVVREGRLPLNSAGEIVLDELPNPVLGTFFPYSLEPGRPLASVVAGKRKIESRATALSISELIEANPGADVAVTQIPSSGAAEHSAPVVLQGKLSMVPVPKRSIDELNRLKHDSTAAGATEATKSNLMEIDTESGSTFLPMDKIESLSFKGKHESSVQNEELKNVLTLKLADAGQGNARVGMMYVENGLRWIPSYKIALNGKGRARVKMEATLVNDLTDLNEVNAQLVIGVPSFIAAGETDPMSLSKTLVEVASHMSFGSLARSGLSNAIMTQTVAGRDDGSSQNESTVRVAGGQKNEDMFVFEVKHISLKKGERMVIPVMEAEVPYEDLYTLDVPIVPPHEVPHSNYSASGDGSGSSAGSGSGEEGLKFLHKVRLKNTLAQPFTTAPALLLTSNQGKETLLAQSLMTYASPNSSSDLTVTTAVDLKTNKVEKESGRLDAAITWLSDKYARINLQGEITVTNLGNKPAKIEINRKVIGIVDGASEGGSMQMLNALNESSNDPLPYWWNYYSWPSWWSQVNGAGKFTFHAELAPGQKSTSSYKWHYFWR